MEAIFADSFIASIVFLTALYAINIALAARTANVNRSLEIEPAIVYLDPRDADPGSSAAPDKTRARKKAMVLWVVIAGALFTVWWLSVHLLAWGPPFLLLLGAMSSIPITGSVLEIPKAGYLRLLRPNNHSGQLKMAMSLDHGIWAYYFLAFAGMFALVAIVASSWFFIGAAAECLVMVHWQRTRMRKARDSELSETGRQSA